MKIEEMTYKEAKWWILNDWKFIELKGSEHFKKDVMLLHILCRQRNRRTNLHYAIYRKK